MHTQHTPPPPPYPEPVSAYDAAQAGTEPPKKGFIRKALPYAATAVVAMIIGGAMGSANDSPTGSSGSSSEVQETKQEVEPEIVYEEVEVEVANQQCLEALDHADEAITIYSNAFTSSADALGAYEVGDYAAMDRHTADIEAASEEIITTLTAYYLASDGCRG